MAVTEVTQAQWKSIMLWNQSEFNGADLPVEKVSQINANQFCSKLTALEQTAGRLPAGFEFRLPTEAEWEYACRAGSTEATYVALEDVAWYQDNCKVTRPVAGKKANKFGLHDMLGNVNEWCYDCSRDYPRRGQVVTDPIGTYGSPIFRGGSWLDSSENCRAAAQNSIQEDAKYNHIGFRIILACSIKK
jgi:formylglycine-generating enzyme required for sulfatase activity